jgi:hypothetical protein
VPTASSEEAQNGVAQQYGQRFAGRIDNRKTPLTLGANHQTNKTEKSIGLIRF